MDIANYHEISQRIIICDQPSRRDLERLADANIQCIVNLSPGNSDFDEAVWVKQLGMSYQEIAVVYKKPDPNDFLRFLNYMNLRLEKKICVHSTDARVASVFVMLYLSMTGKAAQEEAMNEIKNIWLPEAHWEGFFYDVLNRFYRVKQEVETI